MAEYMHSVVSEAGELSAEERNLLSSAYTNSLGSRRAAWRIISSMEQKEKANDNTDYACYCQEYRKRVEGELRDICGKILTLVKYTLIPAATADESKVFFHKLIGDYNGFVHEFTDGDAKAKAAKDACQTYKKATNAAKDLPVTHPIRLDLALTFSVFQYEVLSNPVEACKMAQAAFDDAIEETDNIPEDSYEESTLTLQRLRDNLTLWTSDDAPHKRRRLRTKTAGRACACWQGLAQHLPLRRPRCLRMFGRGREDSE